MSESSVAYNGSCHCNDIKFSFSVPRIHSGMRCNCSICSKKASILSVFTLTPKEIEILSKSESLASYQFGTRTATHYFCRRCGVSPFVLTRLDPGCYRVNLGCLNSLDTNDLKIHLYDGAALSHR